MKRILNQADLFDEFHEAADGVEGFKILINKAIDVILCDINMPGIDGIKFLTMKKARPEYNDIPVVMLTGMAEVKLKVQSLELGANDYVTKPFDPSELIARVRVHSKIKKLQDELKEKNRKLEELSNTDGLTKIYNRRYFMELFELEFQRSSRYGSNLSFIMMDIDNFKEFNDTYGHQLGDKILVEVARILNDNLRVNDVLGRYGGEEFALMMPETDLEGAKIVAERHRYRVEQFALMEQGHELKITISLGVAAYPNDKIIKLDDLIKLSDDALLDAKRTGKNRINVAF